MYNSGFGAYPQDDMDMGVNSYFGESDTNFFGDTSNDSFFGEGCGVTGFGNGEFFNESVGFSTDGSEVVSEACDTDFGYSDMFMETVDKEHDLYSNITKDGKRKVPLITQMKQKEKENLAAKPRHRRLSPLDQKIEEQNKKQRAMSAENSPRGALARIKDGTNYPNPESLARDVREVYHGADLSRTDPKTLDILAADREFLEPMSAAAKKHKASIDQFKEKHPDKNKKSEGYIFK